MKKPLKRFEKEPMARFKKEKFDHIFLFENFEKNSLHGRLTRDDGLPYLIVE